MQCTPYKLENNGTEYEGYVCNGFCEKSEAFPKGIVRFSSPNEHIPVENAMGFDPKNCEEIELRAKIFGEKVTYKEVI